MARRPSYGCHRPQLRALPLEPSRRGERIAFYLLLAALFFTLLALGYVMTFWAPRVIGPIAGALS